MPKLKLPKPDFHCNYWLGDKHQAPAILHGKDGGYFATTADGPIFDGTRLKTFKTPVEALAAIEAAGR